MTEPPPPEQPFQPSWQPPPGYPPAAGAGYGQPAYPPPYPGYPPPRSTSSRATTVMVLGIVALFTFFSFCGLGIVPAIIALVMAPAARREIEASGGALEGAGQVRAGVIMSWITLGLAAIAVIVGVVLILVLVSASGSSTDVRPAGSAVSMVTSG